MRRRLNSGANLVLAVALVIACGGAGVATSSAAPRRGPPPSIVVVLTDDQRWDTLSGMPAVEGALAAHGSTFTNSFVVNSLCCPSRSSLLTGRYSHSTGVYLNSPPFGGFRTFRDSRTIATVLHGAGYRTGFFGKYLNGYGRAAADAHYVPPGWDRWAAFFGGFAYYNYRLAEGGRVTHHGDASPDYSTDVLARKAASFAATARQPFFLEFAPVGPHDPATPPRRYASAFEDLPWSKPPSFNERDLSDKPQYIGRLGLTQKQIEYAETFRRRQFQAALAVDDAVRAIVTVLERRHILGSTMIVFTSDNGVVWGEHALAAARKLVPYEESIRVPLVIRYDPLTRKRRSEDPRLALNIDLAPTFAALAGRTMPRAEGRSLLPVLSGRRVSWRHDFLVEHLGGRPQPDVPTYCAVRGERYKYVLYQTGEEELYDLLLDRYELENRASSPEFAALKKRLRARLDVLCRPRPPGYTAFSP